VKDVTDNYSVADTDTRVYNTGVSTCAINARRLHSNNPASFKLERSLANKTQTHRKDLTEEA